MCKKLKTKKNKKQKNKKKNSESPMTRSSIKNSHVKVGKQTLPVNHVDVVFPELPPSGRAERAVRRDCRSIISRRPVEKQIRLPDMQAILVEERAQKVKLKKNPSSVSLSRRRPRCVAINRSSTLSRNNPTDLTTLVRRYRQH